MKKNRISVRHHDFVELVFYALRYVVGRHTYAVSDVGDLILEYKANLTDKEKDVIKKEVNRELMTSITMHSMDREYWEKFLEKI
jgi:hypothetical protein